MLLLNQAFENPTMADTMNNMPFSYSGHQSFPVGIINEQEHLPIDLDDEDKIKYICGKIVTDEGYQTGNIGVVLTDNTTIHALNRKHKKHDWATDVLSFYLERVGTHLEGDVVASTEMAKERCEEFGWDDESELMLYVIHGTLHLVGYNDQTEDDSRLMRQKEAYYLRLLGIIVNLEDEDEEEEENDDDDEEEEEEDEDE
jgi:probable rRNA maturation factor